MCDKEKHFQTHPQQLESKCDMKVYLNLYLVHSWHIQSAILVKL